MAACQRPLCRSSRLLVLVVGVGLFVSCCAQEAPAADCTGENDRTKLISIISFVTWVWVAADQQLQPAASISHALYCCTVQRGSSTATV
jgi:hypothetical protein